MRCWPPLFEFENGVVLSLLAGLAEAGDAAGEELTLRRVTACTAPRLRHRGSVSVGRACHARPWSGSGAAAGGGGGGAEPQL